MDATEALRDAENSLRDFMAGRLESALGANWTEQLGVKPEKIAKWKERLEEERKKMRGLAVEERLLYYADFYDIAPLVRLHWEYFKDALLDLKSVEMWLGELEKYRDSDAHRRPLFEHQKHLIIGISGEIRSRLIRYRSKMDNIEDYFPRIESVRESLGRIWKPLSLVGMKPITVRVGDEIEYLVTATDPAGGNLFYACGNNWSALAQWSNSNNLSYKFTDQNIGKNIEIGIKIQGSQPHHAHTTYDDMVVLSYHVLPKK